MKPTSKKGAILFALLIFVVCFAIGLAISINYPLANDELYTQTGEIEIFSYWRILSGEIEEGNNSPLFYMVQKGFLSLLGYERSFEWLSGEWFISDREGQIMLRVVSNTCTSLTFVILFYFFATRFSLLWGFYSIFILAMSYMVWPYWFDARPYAMWMMLMTLQTVLFLNIVCRNIALKKVYPRLFVVNIFLAATSFLSIIPICLTSAILILYDKRYWRRISLTTLIPILIILFYYVHAPKYTFGFDFPPIRILLAGISSERLVIFFIAGLISVLLFLFSSDEKRRDSILSSFRQIEWCVLFCGAVFSAGVALIVYLKLKALPDFQFPISNRYFLFMVPISVCTLVYVTRYLFQITNRITWLRILVVLVLGAAFLYRIPRTYGNVFGYFHYGYTHLKR